MHLSRIWILNYVIIELCILQIFSVTLLDQEDRFAELERYLRLVNYVQTLDNPSYAGSFQEPFYHKEIILPIELTSHKFRIPI